MSADLDAVPRRQDQGGVCRGCIAGVEATSNVRRRDKRHQFGVVWTAFAEIAIEVDFHVVLRRYFFGLNALTMASFVVRYGPSIRSMQYGMAGNTASRQSRMALGLPGKLTIKERPRMPAICRDRIAVGTTLSETARISSPKPSSSLSQTASVASGVTSRRAGPVPPVVTTRQQSS